MRTESPAYLTGYHQAVADYETTMTRAAWQSPVLSSVELRAVRDAANRQYWRTMRAAHKKYPIMKEGTR